MPLDRRTFLELLAGAGLVSGAGLVPASLAAATTPTVTDRYFVFAYFQGGWDMLLGLDPRSPDDFPSRLASETGIDPGYQNLLGLAPEDFLVHTDVEGMTFGPYIGDMAAHASRLAVVRGLAGESVAHDVARRHALTGIRPAGTSVRASSVATLLAYLLGQDEPIPNLVCGLDSFNLGHPSWASGLTTQTVDDLFQALSPGRTRTSASSRAALEAFFAEREAGSSSAMLEEIYTNRRTARGIVDLGIADLFDLESGSSEMSALREAFGVDSGLTGPGGPRALMAARALTEGVARCVSFAAAEKLDTHQGSDWQSVAGPRQQEGWDSVAALASHLAATPFGDGSDSWLDHTTIVCMSEFTREPLFNSTGGRDHHIVGTLALLGGGIQGGRVIGATSDLGMLSQAVDLETGAVSEAGESITHAHIARTLLHGIGVEDDVGDFRVPPVRALLELA